MKKLSISLLIGIFFGGAITVFASSTFSDVNGDEWFAGNLTNVSEKGIIKGYPDGTFKPSNNVSRAELVVIIDRTQNYEHARELAFAFLDWSNEQLYPGAHKTAPQEISIGGNQIITSGPNSGSNSDPELTNGAIDTLMSLMEGKSDESIYNCLYRLQKTNLFPYACEIFGDITTEDTEFGFE
ncbi:hypothetical protein COU74_01425 [Candidatus Peregrinibacteria bacterium CG10_big_fil_rev_8_21_14_0_10_36_19]|nr:MAG: hypothetical protein COU74_01425 [Candidatus Peregrinibacteria bacterium CG10_big_fil_rev_8_21_14_0_10_36_19]